MIKEWKNDLNPRRNPWVIFQGDTFEEFLDIATTYVTANPNGINSTLFFFMEDEGIFGAIQLWHHIEHPRLSLEGEGHGHIEYGLRPSARGKWIASELPRLWLIEAKNPGIETIIISADEDNPASWKTIEKCGWEFVQMKVNDGKNQKIYTINVWK